MRSVGKAVMRDVRLRRNTNRASGMVQTGSHGLERVGINDSEHETRINVVASYKPKFILGCPEPLSQRRQTRRHCREIPVRTVSLRFEQGGELGPNNVHHLRGEMVDPFPADRRLRVQAQVEVSILERQVLRGIDVIADLIGRAIHDTVVERFQFGCCRRDQCWGYEQIVGHEPPITNVARPGVQTA